jgi:hypothetical protein
MCTKKSQLKLSIMYFILYCPNKKGSKVNHKYKKTISYLFDTLIDPINNRDQKFFRKISKTKDLNRDGIQIFNQSLGDKFLEFSLSTNHN